MLKITLLLGVLALFVIPGFSQDNSSGNVPKDRPMTFQIRQRPAYPEDAKRNRVEGTAILEVIFQADGTIGEIRCVNDDNEKTQRLIKYEVVQAAIDAVKRIEFEPEIKDGKPVTVTKKVEYTFSIY